MDAVQQGIFDGMMLSDGHLSLSANNANARFSLSTKTLSFAETFRDRMPFPWSPIVRRDVFDKRTNKTYCSVRLRSRVDPFLTDQHSRWYVDKIKIVPRDLVLSRDVVEWWYLGDGHLERKKARPSYRRITLATDSFSNEERQFLARALIAFLESNDVYIECNRVIVIARAAITKFANKIGITSPVADYQYKYDFGNYTSDDYFRKSYAGRPLEKINEYRRKHKVRELNYEQIKELV